MTRIVSGKMEEFYIGLHHPSDAWPFKRCMISVNALKHRKSEFRANEWIMDSGAFTQLYNRGKFTLSAEEYAEHINRFSDIGTLKAAVTQDWMCEAIILQRTGNSIEDHQALTIASYIELRQLTDVLIMAVLQGFEPAEYASHVRQYGSLLTQGQWVGVGSVCKRNGNPDAIEDVLLAIKEQRPDLRLHGFGLKIQAIERPTIRAMLHSSDSMAWSTAGRRQLSDANDPRLALAYAAKVQQLIAQPCLVQDQLFQWWH
jgi:hypothetical protein